MSHAAVLIPETLSAPALCKGLPDLRLGYVPLTDAAPLLVAAAQGLFRQYGLNVELTPAGSWSALRDRVAAGAWDGAQMLGPMPIACHFGLGQAQASLAVTATLGRNGNTLVLGHRLMAEIGPFDWPLSASRLATALAKRHAAGHSAPVLAVVFSFSSHNYLLRHWLADAGIDPEHDVRLVVLPPSQLPDALADGRIDGFCAGEPWGSRAVGLEVGQIVLSSRHIWPNHPEKVLAFATAGLARDPDPALAATAAVIEAAAWLGMPENRPEAASILHRIGLPGVPEAVIALALQEQLVHAPGEPPAPMPDAILNSAAATRPDPAHAVWWLNAMRRWGHVPPGDDTPLALWQPTLWQRAAGLTGLGPIAEFTAPPPPFRSL